MTTTAEIYASPMGASGTTQPAPDLLRVLAHKELEVAAWLDTETTTRAQLLRELAAMSVDPDSGLDRTSDDDIWGFDAEQ
jgi:hypothetical protein